VSPLSPSQRLAALSVTKRTFEVAGMCGSGPANPATLSSQPAKAVLTLHVGGEVKTTVVPLAAQTTSAPSCPSHLDLIQGNCVVVELPIMQRSFRQPVSIYARCYGHIDLRNQTNFTSHVGQQLTCRARDLAITADRAWPKLTHVNADSTERHILLPVRLPRFQQPTCHSTTARVV
jgi:hypothetical protein